MTPKILTKDFVLSFFAQFVFSFVFFIYIPTLPIYLSRLKSTEAEIGILVGALSISSLVLRPLIGRFLLKIPEKDFMIAGALLFAFSSLACLVAKPLWPLLIIRILQGIGLAFFATASFTLVSRISPEAHRGQSLGYFYLSVNIAFALAPSFGMFLINRFNFVVLFLTCTALSIGSLFITLKLRRIPCIPLNDPASQKPPFISRQALPPALMAFMGTILWGSLTAFFPLYALRRGVANPGFFFATLAITLVLARSFGGRILDIYSREKVILPCLLVQIFAMFLLAISTSLSMFVLVAVIWGMGTAFFYPTLVACTIDLAGSSRGPAIGTYMALSDFGSGIGSVVMGIILQLFSYPTMFFCLILTGAINLFYFYFFVRGTLLHFRGR